MSAERLFPPSEKGRRAPTSNAKRNGDIVNPPRYPEMGGFDRASKGPARNALKIRPPK